MRKLALSLALILLAAPAFAAGGKFNKVVKPGDKAPDFSGIPATLPNGQDASLTLGDIKEDVVVLVFLANHCPAVVAYEDRLIDLVDSFKGKNVKVVGVAVSSADEDKLPAIKKYMDEKHSNYVYGYDESQAIGKAYGAAATPTYFVLDKSRTIRYLGALDDNYSEKAAKRNYVKDAVNAILANETVEVTETQARGCGIHYGK